MRVQKRISIPQTAAAFAVALLLLGWPAASALAQDKQDIPVVWELSEAEANSVAAKLNFDGAIQPVEGEAVRGVPLVALVGVAVLPSLVESLINFYRDLTQGGVIIDAQGEEIKITTNTDIPYGTILVRDANGVEMQSFRSTPRPADLASAIVQAVKVAAVK